MKNKQNGVTLPKIQDSSLLTAIISTIIIKSRIQFGFLQTGWTGLVFLFGCCCGSPLLFLFLSFCFFILHFCLALPCFLCCAIGWDPSVSASDLVSQFFPFSQLYFPFALPHTYLYLPPFTFPSLAPTHPHTFAFAFYLTASPLPLCAASVPPSPPPPQLCLCMPPSSHMPGHAWPRPFTWLHSSSPNFFSLLFFCIMHAPRQDKTRQTFRSSCVDRHLC